ncbi:MAG: hypothetical protein K2G58_01500 [Alistipes sp.]|nr:hypothetical protein [Alistipes sp.]
MKSTVALLLVSSGGESVARRVAEIVDVDRFALVEADGFRRVEALQYFMGAAF